MTLAAPYPLLNPGGDADLVRAWNDLRRLLNRPHRSEYTVAVQLYDALPFGRGAWGSFPTSLYGASPMDMVAGKTTSAALPAGSSFAVNTLRAIPFMVDGAFTISAISAETTANVATAQFRLGIYSSKDDERGDYNPDRLIVGSTPLSGSASFGLKTYSTSVTLEPGHVYHAAAVSWDAAPTMRQLGVSQMHAHGWGSGGTMLTHVSVAYAGGSSFLPSVFPAGSTMQSGVMPAIFLTMGANSSHPATLVQSGAGPAVDGHFIKRVRILKANGQGRTSSSQASVKVRAMMSGDGTSVTLGEYDSRTDALAPNKARVISSGDLDKAVPAGSVFQAEITQYGWPKVSFRDAVVLFDVGVI